MLNALPYLKAVSTISAIFTYNLLQQWIDHKLDVKWKYLLCVIFADTAFLRGGAELGIMEFSTVFKSCTCSDPQYRSSHCVLSYILCR